MANQFKGYLLKAGTIKFSNRWLAIDSYKSTPNRREEIEAYRDDNTRDLYRVTASGKKTSIEFETMELNLDEKISVQNFFGTAMIDELQRKVHLEYWNDEENVYKESDFYLPDIDFTIQEIDETDNDIVYKPLQIKLIEY